MVGLVEDRYKCGSNQQLESPPKINIWEDISGSVEKTDLKKITIVPIRSINIHKKYLTIEQPTTDNYVSTMGICDYIRTGKRFRSVKENSHPSYLTLK